MAEQKKPTTPTQGGSYVRRGDKLERKAYTRDHPEGNRPRDAQGWPLDRPAAPAAKARPAPEETPGGQDKQGSASRPAKSGGSGGADKTEE